MSVSGSPTSLKESLAFLTRDGGVNTPDVVNNLDGMVSGF